MTDQKSVFFLFRPPFLLTAIISLVFGVWGGLWRSGWNVPLPAPASPVIHGPLMVCAFLGILISLERAVALDKLWGYTAPGFALIGTLFLFAAPGLVIIPVAFMISSLLLTGILGYFFRRDRQLHFAVMTAAPLFWFVGNLLWFQGHTFSQVVLWWAAFLVITIAGERLELSRILRLTAFKKVFFLLSLALLTAGAVLTTTHFQEGVRLFSVGMILLGIWLLRYDMARKNIVLAGLSKYLGWALIPGYLWLIISGVIGIITGAEIAGPLYDAFLHGIFVGFIFSMIFGHAPVIFPAILQRPLPFSAYFYIPLVLLHLSLVVRLWGDLLFQPDIRLYGSLGNAAAILLFIVIVALSILSGRKSAPEAG